MTLNILLSGREAVYLSGDFRITKLGLGSRSYIDDLNVQKLVPIVKFGWCGFISFCGVAKLADGRPVGDWIVEQVQPASLDCKLRDVVGRLRNADKWLAHVFGYRRFSMVFAGLEGRRPFTYLFSNFENLDGDKFESVTSQLRLVSARPKQPEIRFFGDPSKDQKESGKLLLQSFKRDPRVDLTTEIAALNNKSKNDSVSSECIVGRIFATGRAEIRPFVNRQPGYMPNFIRQDFIASGIHGLKLKTDDTGKMLQPSWVGAAYTLGKVNGDDVVTTVHAVANAEEPIGGKSSRRGQVFWKIAEENEPPIKLTFKQR